MFFFFPESVIIHYLYTTTKPNKNLRGQDNSLGDRNQIGWWYTIVI